MVRVSQLGQLGRGVGGNLASDILNIVSGVAGVAANAVDGQQATGAAAQQPTAEQIAAQQAAIAKAKADAEAKKTWMYVGIGAGVLVIGGLFFIATKKKE